MAQVGKEHQSGRVVKRWMATCAVVIHEDRRAPAACGFNDRQKPKLHTTAEAATHESVKHLVDQHDLHGASEVKVRRTYTPRTIASEEVIS
jgi:hypothetical protein